MTDSFDAIIVGGGAAGLMCAGAAAAGGLRVLVIEGRERPARKLLITGKGRCNLTNDCSPEDFIRQVRTNPRFMYSAINSYTPADTMALFEKLGVPLKVERGNRVFPVSDKAMDIVDALVAYAKGNGARIITGRVSEITCADGAVTGVTTAAGVRHTAPAVALCTGGMSYPATGSDGEGYKLVGDLGHTIIPPRASLVPIVCENTDKMFSRLMGLSLRNVTLALADEKGRSVWSELGEMLFTHFGVSGPLALTASTYMDEPVSRFRLTIDLKPGLTAEQLDDRLLRDFGEGKNKQLANALDALLPRTMIPEVIRLSAVPEETRINQMTREQRAALCGVVKAFPLQPASLAPIEEAVITSGGVSTRAIDPKTMRSKLVGGLYFAGEVIDVDARTGGYNLQIAWSTAQAAARAMINNYSPEDSQ